MKYGKASKTAELSAMIRTLATKNIYGLQVFFDPLSKYFVGTRTRFIYLINSIHSLINPAFWSKGMNSVGYLLSLCRHRFIYEELKLEIQSSQIQVLIIGAGYDTSYLMLKDKITTQQFFELDFPATQQRKKKILNRLFHETPNLHFCEIDLKQKSVRHALAESKFNKDLPTFIIIEGVLSYLTKPEIEELLKELSTLSKQVKIIADYRKPALEEEQNDTAKKWTRSFSDYHEKYVSFYTEDEMYGLLKKLSFNVEKNTDLLDLWITQDKLLPNEKLKDFGGIFIAKHE